MEDGESTPSLKRESLVIKYSSLTVLTAILFAIGLQIESRRHEGAVVGGVSNLGTKSKTKIRN